MRVITVLVVMFILKSQAIGINVGSTLYTMLVCFMDDKTSQLSWLTITFKENLFFNISLKYSSRRVKVSNSK